MTRNHPLASSGGYARQAITWNAASSGRRLRRRTLSLGTLPKVWFCECRCHVADVGCSPLCCAWAGVLGVMPAGAAKPTQLSEPLRGYKLADVVLVLGHHGHEVRFAGIGHSTHYGAEDPAICTAGSGPHEAPALYCTCGYWSLFSEADATGAAMSNYDPQRRWLLEIDVFGVIIRHERGYRSSRQRTLKVTAPPACECGATARFLYRRDRFVGGICLGCAEAIAGSPSRSRRVLLSTVRDGLRTDVEAPFIAPDDEPWPDPPPAPEPRGVSGDISVELAELLATLTSCASGRAPRELFDAIIANTTQRYSLLTVNSAYPPYLEIVTNQGQILLRFVDCSGYTLWQTLLRQGPPIGGLNGPRASI